MPPQFTHSYTCIRCHVGRDRRKRMRRVSPGARVLALPADRPGVMDDAGVRMFPGKRSPRPNDPNPRIELPRRVTLREFTGERVEHQLGEFFTGCISHDASSAFSLPPKRDKRIKETAPFVVSNSMNL